MPSGAQNFMCSIIDSQLTGRLTDAAGNPTPAAMLLDVLDKAFTGVFTAELAVNMASNLWTRFVHDPWCPSPSVLPRTLKFHRSLHSPRSAKTDCFQPLPYQLPPR